MKERNFEMYSVKFNGPYWFRKADGTESERFTDLKALDAAYDAEWPEKLLERQALAARRAAHPAQPTVSRNENTVGEWCWYDADRIREHQEELKDLPPYLGEIDQKQAQSHEVTLDDLRLLAAGEFSVGDQEDRFVRDFRESVRWLHGENISQLTKAELMEEAHIELRERMFGSWAPQAYESWRAKAKEGNAGYPEKAYLEPETPEDGYTLDSDWCRVCRVNPRKVLADLARLTDYQFYCKWGTHPLNVDLEEKAEYDPMIKTQYLSRREIKGLMANRHFQEDGPRVERGAIYGEDATMTPVDLTPEGEVKVSDEELFEVYGVQAPKAQRAPQEGSDWAFAQYAPEDE